MKKLILAAALLSLVSCKKENILDNEINRVFINARCESCTIKYTQAGNLQTQASVIGSMDASILVETGSVVTVSMWSDKKTEMLISVSTNDEKTNYLKTMAYKPGEIFFNSVNIK